MERSIRIPVSRTAALIILLVAVAAMAASTPAQSQSFNIVKVTNDVYAAIGQNGVFGNGSFIVTQDYVVVVDTQLRPTWARDMISEIKKVTDKPVRYVINTHWHSDHTLGNQAYVAAYGPTVEFIGQSNTREDLVAKGVPNLQVQLNQAVPDNIARLQKQLADGKDARGNALTADARTALEFQLSLQQAYLAELPQVHIVPSTITYENEMSIHAPDKEIRLYHFSYAHTRGDTVVYLPKEKVIITGDLLTNGIPNTRTSYPVEWITTLEGMDKLDWTTAIPGHGDVQQGKTQLETLLAYWKDVVAGVRAAVAKGLTLDQTQSAIDLTKYRASFPNFDASNPLAIERTWTELTGKPME
jgi:glyoxylase-like metal-dependent hydrolase (beta-lactamase superfamily II)